MKHMRATTPDGRSTSAVAESFIAPNSRLTAFERLEIYNRQYWFRVLGALAEDFPGLRAVIGGRRFDALSIAYLTAHPSRSFTLRNLGSKLPEWLAAHPEQAGRRHRLAVDVARIEWAFVEAFDSAEHASAYPRPDRHARRRFAPRPAAAPAAHRARVPGRRSGARACTSGKSARPVKPGWSTTTAMMRPSACRDCAATQPGSPRIAWTFRSTIARLEREEFQMLAAIREGCR